MRFLRLNTRLSRNLTFIINWQLAVFQRVIKKLQKRAKKNRKKSNAVLKKCLPLQRFNKQ